MINILLQPNKNVGYDYGKFRMFLRLLPSKLNATTQKTFDIAYSQIRD